MDGIKKYDGSICKEGYYRFQTRSWFDLDRMTLSRWACGTLTAQDMLLSKHSPFKIVSKLEEAHQGLLF